MSDVMYVRTNASFKGGPPVGECGPMERSLAEALIKRGSAVDCSDLGQRSTTRDTFGGWQPTQPSRGPTSTPETTSDGPRRPSSSDTAKTSESDTQAESSSSSPTPATSGSNGTGGSGTGDGPAPTPKASSSR